VESRYQTIQYKPLGCPNSISSLDAKVPASPGRPKIARHGPPVCNVAERQVPGKHKEKISTSLTKARAQRNEARIERPVSPLRGSFFVLIPPRAHPDAHARRGGTPCGIPASPVLVCWGGSATFVTRLTALIVHGDARHRAPVSILLAAQQPSKKL
jgi:hypothetical protein